MALVRRRGNVYHIRSIRQGGRVTSRCLGTGDRAIQLEAGFQASRPGPGCLAESRKAEREARRAEALEDRRKAALGRERERDLDDKVERAAGLAKGLAAEAMVAAGFHQHRWAWRRRRSMTTETARAQFEDLARKAEARLSAEDREEAAGVVDKVAAFDASRPAGSPSGIKLLEKVHGSNPGREITELLIAKWSADPTGAELLRRQVEAMKVNLLGDQPTAIERLIVEQVAAAYLASAVRDRIAINIADSAVFEAAEKEAFEKSAARAQRRYVETLKALALIRARALPSLRLSMAHRDGQTGSTTAAVVEVGNQAARPGRPPAEASHPEE